MSQYVIMYVEDDPDIRELVELIMERESDIRMIVCEPGPDILQRVRQLRPDLLLIDVMMPGLDGVTIAGMLRAQQDLADLPFVFMTAKARPTEQAELLALKPLGIIAKPFEALQLAGQLRRLLRQSSQSS